MTLIANVALTDTFDIWRTRTNQVIVKTNQLDTANIITITSNTSTINVTGQFRLGNTVYLDSNAFPTTGGTISGNTTFTANATFNSNVSFNANVIFRSNTTFSSNVSITGGVLDLL